MLDDFENQAENQPNLPAPEALPDFVEIDEIADALRQFSSGWEGQLRVSANPDDFSEYLILHQFRLTPTEKDVAVTKTSIPKAFQPIESGEQLVYFDQSRRVPGVAVTADAGTFRLKIPEAIQSVHSTNADSMIFTTTTGVICRWQYAEERPRFLARTVDAQEPNKTIFANDLAISEAGCIPFQAFLNRESQTFDLRKSLRRLLQQRASQVSGVVVDKVEEHLELDSTLQTVFCCLQTQREAAELHLGLALDLRKALGASDQAFLPLLKDIRVPFTDHLRHVSTRTEGEELQLKPIPIAKGFLVAVESTSGTSNGVFVLDASFDELPVADQVFQSRYISLAGKPIIKRASMAEWYIGTAEQSTVYRVTPTVLPKSETETLDEQLRLYFTLKNSKIVGLVYRLGRDTDCRPFQRIDVSTVSMASLLSNMPVSLTALAKFSRAGDVSQLVESVYGLQPATEETIERVYWSTASRIRGWRLQKVEATRPIVSSGTAELRKLFSSKDQGKHLS